MKKILLYYPKTMYEEGINYFHVPYSLLSLITLFDSDKFEFVIFDKNIEDCAISNPENILCIGISAMIGHQIRDGLNFSKEIKKLKPNIPIIWGGALPTMLPEETITNEYIDIIVRGQGEITFKELVEHLDSNKQIDNILGISYKQDNKNIHNADRQLQTINSFPNYQSFYHKIKIEKYIRNDININSRTISYHSSQGCVFNCGFCCESKLWNKKWFGFSLNQIKLDINYLIDNFQINGIKFYDSEFFTDRKRAIEFANYLISENKSIKWGAAINPINFLKFKYEDFQLFRDSGLSRLMIGIESLSNNKNNLINKELQNEDIINICQISKDNNIAVCFSFIVGFPNDSDETIEETIVFAGKLRDINKKNEVQINFYSPYPGTPLYDIAINKGFKPPKNLIDWSWYDYRNINTPWIDSKYTAIIREFNEENYPFMLKKN